MEIKELEKMLKLLPQNKKMDEERKRNILYNLRVHFGSAIKMKTKTRKGFVMTFASLATVLIITLLSISYINLNNLENETASINETLDISKLKLDEEKTSPLYLAYEPVSLEIAKQVIPFQAKFPANLPEETFVYIRQLDQAGKKVMIETNYVLKNAEGEQLITFTAENVDRNVSVENSHEEIVELDNGKRASYQVGYKSFVLLWEDQNVWYKLSTVNLDQLNEEANVSDEQINAKKQELIKIVNRMQ